MRKTLKLREGIMETTKKVRIPYTSPNVEYVPKKIFLYKKEVLTKTIRPPSNQKTFFQINYKPLPLKNQSTISFKLQ